MQPMMDLVYARYSSFVLNFEYLLVGDGGLGISYGEPEEPTPKKRVMFDPNLVPPSVLRGHSMVYILLISLLLSCAYPIEIQACE